jgi:hypothetical protein
LRAETVKAWVGVICATVPLSWALFASADTVYGFVVTASVMAGGFYLGYARNRRGVRPAILIVLGYLVAISALLFAIAAETVAFYVLVFTALMAIGTITAGIGSLVRRHIRPRPTDSMPVNMADA